MPKTREQKRNYRADKVCRELRYQLSNYGEIKNYGNLYDLILSWKNVGKKSMYKRPYPDNPNLNQ